MNRIITWVVAALVIALAGCGSQNDPSTKPDPRPVTADAVGHYCSMDLIEHEGPKGQIFIKGNGEPLWFSSIRQTLAYTIMPESPKGLDAIYVTDMAAVKDMRRPEDDSWMDARDAYYVTESRLPGGMGGEDPLPFSDRSKAEGFVADYGGKILTFDEIPEDYILHYDMFKTSPMSAVDNAIGGQQ